MGVIPLSKQALDSFKKLYLDKYNIRLSDEDAQAKASKLLSFLRRIGYPCEKNL
jgi:hypothetical protein